MKGDNLAAARPKVLYAEIQTQIMEEGTVIIPYFRPVLTALRQTVHGFTPYSAGWLDFGDVRAA